MGFDDHFDVEGAITRVVDELEEKHGAEWVSERREFLQDRLAEVVYKASKDLTPSVVQGLKRDAPEMLSDRRARRGEYREMIEEHWAEAFDLYEMVLRIGFEAGTDFGESRVERLGQQRTFQILTRLHARGCRIAEEVLILLKNGYGQGALARWRSLHEVTCVAMFIAKHGEEVAERYLLHDVVESCMATKAYEQCAARLGYEPLAEGELEELQEEVERLRARFGKAFLSQYGWAAEVLGRDPELKKLRGFSARRPSRLTTCVRTTASPAIRRTPTPRASSSIPTSAARGCSLVPVPRVSATPAIARSFRSPS
jgi:hypothetical protein